MLKGQNLRNGTIEDIRQNKNFALTFVDDLLSFEVIKNSSFNIRKVKAPVLIHRNVESSVCEVKHKKKFYETNIP